MTLGEKIKSERKRKGMTQAELCAGHITRNMLSGIENGTALPSLDTLLFIAKGLGVPAGFLLSDEYDINYYDKIEAVAKARRLYKDGNYSECIKLLTGTNYYDEETEYILCYCEYYTGLSQFSGGSLSSAEAAFNRALSHAERTPYDTSLPRRAIPLYLAICKNYSLPLLDFDGDGYANSYLTAHDVQLYRYLKGDYDFNYDNKQYELHLNAKRLIKERRLSEAVDILTSIEDTKRDFPPNAYLMFSVYTDLEFCYKSMLDFEKAYRYASKRISIIEGFST